MRKKQKSFSRIEIRDIAIKFSKNPSLVNCAKELGITGIVLKSLLYDSISKCIVEADMANVFLKVIREFVIQNGDDSALIGFNLICKQIIAKRKSFMLSNYQAICITIRYSSSPLNKKQFCFENAITCSLLDRTLLYTTCNCMVEDDIVEALNKKALSHDSCNESLVNELFEKIAEARRKFRQEHS